LFHFKYCINCLLTLALSAQLRSARESFEIEDQNPEDYAKNQDRFGKMQYTIDYYVERVENISHIVHPFFMGSNINTSERTGMELINEMEKIKGIVSDCNIMDKHHLIDKAERQLPDIAINIDWWWTIVDKQVDAMSLTVEIKKWFRDILLPTAYWNYAIKKTKYKPTIDILKSELSLCQDINIFGKQLGIEQFKKLKDEANYLCRLFQRASSQVEGRNGYLSMMNHTQRGFDEQRLEVLTVVHNFDIHSDDGSTPAERLYGKEINDISIFDYLLQNISEFPYSRRRQMVYVDN